MNFEFSLLDSTTTTIVVVIGFILVLILAVWFWKKGYLSKVKKSLPTLVNMGKKIHKRHLERLAEAEKEIKAKQVKIVESEKSLNQLTQEQKLNEDKKDEKITVDDFLSRNS